MPDFELTSSAFGEGEQIPEKYSCEGDNDSPPSSWTLPPRRDSLPRPDRPRPRRPIGATSPTGSRGASIRRRVASRRAHRRRPRAPTDSVIPATGVRARPRAMELIATFTSSSHWIPSSTWNRAAAASDLRTRCRAMCSPAPSWSGPTREPRSSSRRAGSASRSCRPSPPWRGSSARSPRGSNPPRRR